MARSQILNLVGYFGSVLLAVIVARLAWNGLARKFPWFVAYLSFVLGSSLLALWIYRAHSNAYTVFYWVSEVTALILGVAVSSEVLRKAFASFPAIRNFQLSVLRVLLAAAVFRVALTSSDSAANFWFELDRDVRLLQALLLISIGSLSLYYSIRLNRNQIGILGGYSFFICFSVINLALRSHVGAAFHAVWDFLQPVQYIVCETVWCVSLWNVAAEVSPDSPAWVDDCPAATLETRLRRLRGQMNLRSIS